MTDTKTPKPGEWWMPKSGKPYFCIAANRKGDTVWQDEDDSIFLHGDDWCWKHWHHEPRCDSFDWVEPEPEPEQAEWSDMAAIQNLDLRRAEMAGRISWAENQAIAQVIAIAKRAIQPVEMWPKYYVGKNWSDLAAYVRFDNATDQCVWVSAYGSEETHDETYAYVPDAIRRHSWREITEAEALARIKPVETDPPPFAKPFTNPRSGMGIMKEPVESPDDWVTQDRVPVRVGDECWWGNSKYSEDKRWWPVSSESHTIGLMHGVTHNVAFVTTAKHLTLNVRCRRKDLPVPMTLQSVAELCTSKPAKTPNVVTPGTLKLTPVEEMDLSDKPDEWVEITDPKYVLRQGDQFTHCMSGDKWVDVVRTHGDWLGAGWKARCRRRDLPLPPQSKTIEVSAGEGWRWVEQKEPWQEGDECLICDGKYAHTHNAQCWRRRTT